MLITILRTIYFWSTFCSKVFAAVGFWTHSARLATTVSHRRQRCASYGRPDTCLRWRLPANDVGEMARAEVTVDAGARKRRFGVTWARGHKHRDQVGANHRKFVSSLSFFSFISKCWCLKAKFVRVNTILHRNSFVSLMFLTPKEARHVVHV